MEFKAIWTYNGCIIEVSVFNDNSLCRFFINNYGQKYNKKTIAINKFKYLLISKWFLIKNVFSNEIAVFIS